VVVLVACSGGGGTKTTHPEPVRPDGQGSSSAVATNDGGPVVSEDRCAKLIVHAFAVATAERPPDQKLTDDESATIRKQLHDAWLPFCQRMTAAGYECALGARTLVDLDACGKS